MESDTRDIFDSLAWNKGDAACKPHHLGERIKLLYCNQNLVIKLLGCQYNRNSLSWLSRLYSVKSVCIPWLEGNNSAKPTFNMYSLPEKCQAAGERFKDASNRQDEMVTAVYNSYSTNFRRCLREVGYTKAEIDEAYDGIKNSRWVQSLVI